MVFVTVFCVFVTLQRHVSNDKLNITNCFNVENRETIFFLRGRIVMKKKRVLCAILATTLVLTASMGLGGCNKKEKAGSASTSAEFLDYLKDAEYPIETDKTISWWTIKGPANYNWSKPDDVPSMVAYKKSIGVDIDWKSVSGNVKQQFSLLVASGDFPDIVTYEWGVAADVPGGPDKAISDGFITPMDDLLEYYAPDIVKYIEENPSVEKELKTNEGHYYYIPCYVTTEEQNGDSTNGYVFRKDWLDDLGLAVPETIEDWYVALKAFKEKKGAEAPISMNYNYMKRGLTNPYGIALGLYKEGSTIKYGYAERGFLEFVKEMNKWYKEGILDKSIVTVDDSTVNANMLTGRTGATLYWKGNIRTMMTEGPKRDSSFSIVGVPFPVMKKGDIPTFGDRDSMTYTAGAAISQKSQNKELAMKVLNYGFTDEGRELMLFGTEGESFNIEDGNYVFTDLVMNNPDGLTFSQATGAYVRNGESIPYLKSYSGLRANYKVVDVCPEVDEAIAAWSKNEPQHSQVPYSLAPDNKVSGEYAKLQTEIGTYAEEMLLKFIVGEESLENFDKYIAELNKRGLPRLLEIAQEAYDAYLDR